MKSLFLGGVPDSGKADVVTTVQGDLSVIMSGSSNLARFLTTLPGQQGQFYLAGQGGDQHYSLNFFPDVIINEISDPDSHHFALKRCMAFCEQQGKPIVNNPVAILGTTRDAVAKKLQGIAGLQMPITLRISPRSPQEIIDAVSQYSLQYPVIFRAAGDHGGISTVRIDRPEESMAATYAYALDGRDYYLTPFVDYQSEDGFYRKYRLVVVDGKVFLRHLIISDQWLVHAGGRNGTEQTMEEEKSLLETFQHELAPALQPMIQVIHRAIGLDYFGIDCAINRHREMTVFEVNANMNILVNQYAAPNIWEKPITDIIAALTTVITKRAGL